MLNLPRQEYVETNEPSFPPGLAFQSASNSYEQGEYEQDSLYGCSPLLNDSDFMHLLSNLCLQDNNSQRISGDKSQPGITISSVVDFNDVDEIVPDENWLSEDLASERGECSFGSGKVLLS